MTIQFDIDIIAAVERGDIIITDFDASEEGPLGTNSYDVRIDGLYLLEVLWADDGPWFVQRPAVPIGERINIPVGGTLLARTLQRVGTKGRFTAEMKARSSIGKTGFSVCKCAGLGDVGFNNHWTMELSAFTRSGQPWVIAGSRIAQMMFYAGKRKPRSPYTGQYLIEDWPQCMVPEDWRHHIVDSTDDIPGYNPLYVGGKVA